MIEVSDELAMIAMHATLKTEPHVLLLALRGDDDAHGFSWRGSFNIQSKGVPDNDSGKAFVVNALEQVAAVLKG